MSGVTIELQIDMLQQLKKNLTDKIIKDPILNKTAHNFINSQTQFAKMLINNFTDISKYYVDSQTKVLFPQ
jgi:hypothetical protein